MRETEKKKRNRIFSIITLLIIGVVGYSIWRTIDSLRPMLLGEMIAGKHFVSVAGVLRQKAPSGSRIFHTNWSDSQYLIGLAPQYEYLVTLDPIYMYNYNPQLYNLYRQVSFAGHPDPYTALKDIFGTQWGYAGKNYFSAFISQIRKDPRFKIEGEDSLGVVFSLN